MIQTLVESRNRGAQEGHSRRAAHIAVTTTAQPTIVDTFEDVLRVMMKNGVAGVMVGSRSGGC